MDGLLRIFSSLGKAVVGRSDAQLAISVFVLIRLNLLGKVIGTLLKAGCHGKPQTGLQAINHTLVHESLVASGVIAQSLLSQVQVVHDETVHGVERRTRVVAQLSLAGGFLHDRHRESIYSSLLCGIIQSSHTRLAILIESVEVEIEHGTIAVALTQIRRCTLVAALHRALGSRDDIVGILDECIIVVEWIIICVAQSRSILCIRPVVIAIVAHREILAEQVAHVHLARITPVLGIVATAVGIPSGEERRKTVGKIFQRLA